MENGGDFGCRKVWIWGKWTPKYGDRLTTNCRKIDGRNPLSRTWRHKNRLQENNCTLDFAFPKYNVRAKFNQTRVVLWHKNRAVLWCKNGAKCEEKRCKMRRKICTNIQYVNKKVSTIQKKIVSLLLWKFIVEINI